LLSGGLEHAHSFATTSALLADCLASAGIESDVCSDVDAGLTELGAYDLLTVNGLWWTMAQERFAPLRTEHAFRLGRSSRTAVTRHLAAGRGVLSVHTACICFDDWPEWGAIVGARWDWGRSYHPPPGDVRVTVAADSHPIVAGVDGFGLVDELYCALDVADDIVTLATARPEAGGTREPVMWILRTGGGRVACDTLGHDERAYASAPHRMLLARAGAWAAGGAR
jgi:hypothetical protein